ncbi:LysR substrate-binding domain-containing protein [Bradyrhizobium aeschynomenes]|uniref:LysR substrate-binding domain-containing protein n=1 Tax=Bradyrhizobium aeschynomenes TaxID=2734909 RepID=UPI001FEEDFD9|nr:LysR substrate-binding domain-containing protein [Bradyrhizobium aeschynomenes]
MADGADIKTSLRSRLGVNTIDAAIDAALSGAGLIRAVSYQVAEHVRAGRLALVLEQFEPMVRPVHLVYDAQNRLPLKLRAFVDFVVPRLRRRMVEVALDSRSKAG